MKKLEDYIRTIPDFPEPGIMFRDITTVFQDADGLKLAIDSMEELVKDLDYDVIVGAESRGFIYGAALAYNLHKPLILVRKKGKLPWETISQEYDLEYGKAVLEIHRDAIKPGEKALIVDDLLATGGTARAMAKLVEKLGGEVVGMLFMIELAGLKGREFLGEYRVDSALIFEGK
ncbi:MAG: adenine phosphoribosyltransferase [Eubacteriales bacterium]|nr:adenine phosphoribosyltransferase [Eubacteriales bacterium]